jgi:Ca-activated chloride channel family protein
VRRQLSSWVVLPLACARLLPAQEQPSRFRVSVDLVVLTFTVTDARGRYVGGLKPSDVRILEDGKPQKVIAFAAGTTSAVASRNVPPDTLSDTKVFVLFDTSNWMYAGFPYAVDAVTTFVRQLDNTDSIALYTFSKNLFRSVLLTSDREQVLAGVRSVIAGDATALYNTLLLTLRDAAKTFGRKAVVVFSNGPDNASIISPDDVAAIAEDEGIPVYIISTSKAQEDPISTNVFERITARTGGQLFWAHTWQKQAQAFTSISEDLANSYTVAYYPEPNFNEGFRRIRVDVISGKYQVRARLGYHAHDRQENQSTEPAALRRLGSIH